MAFGTPQPLNVTSGVVNLNSTSAVTIFSLATTQTALIDQIWAHASSATSVNVSINFLAGTQSSRIAYENVQSNAVQNLIPYVICLAGSSHALTAVGDTTAPVTLSSTVRTGF